MFVGQALKCSENHRWFVIGKGWTEARHLLVEDNVLSSLGVIPVTGIKTTLLGENIDVYNVEVASGNSYLVGTQGCLVVDRWPVDK